MANRQSDSEYRIAYAWYRREQWALLRGASVDSDCLEEFYDDWLPFAEKSFKQRKADGLDIHKVDVDVEELIEWCREKNLPLDGAARASFAATKLQDSHKGKN